MPDVITVIIQGIDRLTGVSDRATANLRKEVKDLKGEMSDTGQADHLQLLVDDLRNAMDPGPAERLRREFELLKQDMSDTGRVDKFRDSVSKIGPSMDADVQALSRFRRAQDQLKSDLDGHIRKLAEWETQNRLTSRSLQDLGHDATHVGDNVQELSLRVERMKSAMTPGQASLLDQELKRLLASAGQSSDFDRFSDRLERFSARSNASTSSVQTFRNALVDARSELSTLQRSVDDAAQSLDAVGHDATTEAENLTRLGDRVKEVRTDHDFLARSAEGAVEGILDLGHAVERSAVDLEHGGRTLDELGKSVIGLLGSLGRLSIAWVEQQAASGRVQASWSNIGSNLQSLASSAFDVVSRASRGFTSSLSGMNVLIAAAVALFPLLTSALQFLAGVLVAAGGTVLAFASALSALVGVLVVIPAAVVAAIGAFGSFFLTFLGPLQQIIQGVQFLRQRASGQRAAATGGGQDPVAQAEQNLQYTRQQNAEQLRLQEQQYHDLVVHDRQQEADAQTNLNRIREQAAQRLLAAEQQLAQVRQQNQITRQQLEEQIALARVALGNADSAMGQRIAQGDLSNAQLQLQQFNASPQGHAEVQATQNLAQVRKQNAQDIQDAETRLHRTVMDNIRQELEARERLQMTVQQNLHQEVQAAQAVTQAQKGLAGGASSAQKSWDALSPTVQRVAREVYGLWTLLQSTLAPIRAQFFNFISEVVTTLRDNIGPVSGIVKDFSNAILGTLREGFNKIKTDPSLQTALHTDFAEGAGGVRTMGDAFIHLASGILKVTSAAKPLLDFLANGFDAFARWVDKASTAAVASGEMKHFFTDVRDVVRQLLDIFKNLIIGFTNVFKVGFGPGDSLLTGLDRLSRKFRDWTATAGGRNSMVKFFQDSIDAGKSLLRLIASIISGLAHLGRDEIQQPRNTQAGDLFARSGPSPTTGQSNLTTGLNTASSAVPKIVSWIETFNKQHGAEVRQFVKDIFELAKAIIGLEIAVQPFVTLIFKLFTVLAAILSSRVVQDLALAILGLVAAVGAISIVKDVISLLVTDPEILALVLLAVGIVELVRHFHDLADAAKWLWQQFTHFIGAIVSFVKDHWKTIGEIMIAIFVPGGLVIAAFLRFHTQIINFFTGLWHDMVHLAGRIAGDVLGELEKIPDFFIHTLPSIAGQAVHSIGHFFSLLWAEIKKYMDLLVNLFEHPFSKLATEIEKIPGVGFATRVIGGALGHLGFDVGGEVGGRRSTTGSRQTGHAVPIIAHAGEWILNDEQQMRVARMLGGLEAAKRYLFHTPVLRPRTAYDAGGPVFSPQAAAAGGTNVLMPLSIVTSSPTVDIDYVMRRAEVMVREALSK